MNAFRMVVSAATAALLSALLFNPAFAQKSSEFLPQIGQPGKDVIWVPTPDEIVERMLRMAQTTPNDYVIDLGAGDGKIAIAAAKKFGARSLGIEYDSDMAKHAQANVVKAGAADRASILQGDIFAVDFMSATVLTMYLLPALNLKLRPTILSMKPGTRVVSHSFTMEDWEADEVSSADGRRAYLWIVPANVHGSWKLSVEGGESYDLSLDQRYQKVHGHVTLGSVRAGLRQVSLSGTSVNFTFVDNAGERRDFTGYVDGNLMQGTLRTGDRPEVRWSATK